MKVCQFTVQPGGRTCGIAATGDYCWFHEGMMRGVQTDAGQTHTVGTSHAWSTTNTTPERAVDTALAMRPAPRRASWWSGLVWWKVLIALAIVVVLVYFFWPYLLILAGLLLVGMFLRFLGGMNFNSNRNANENVNQNTNTVSPTFINAPVFNVRGDDD
jgi:hypothetical protein